MPDRKADVWLVNLYNPSAHAAGLKQEDREELNRMLENRVMESIKKATG